MEKRDRKAVVSMLKKEQRKHFKTVEWLVSDAEESWGKGRSTLLAMALVLKAAEKVGVPVQLFDHAGTGEQMPRVVMGLLGRLSDLSKTGWTEMIFEIDWKTRRLTRTK